MVILAFLQNMWVKNPESSKKTLKRNPKIWNRMVKSYLFTGCVTGSRIKKAFGEDLAFEIIYDECTKELADNPKTICKPDPKHILDTITAIQPDIIIMFGQIAQNAVGKVIAETHCITKHTELHSFKAPHPAARQPDTLSKLMDIAEKVRYSIQTINGRKKYELE